MKLSKSLVAAASALLLSTAAMAAPTFSIVGGTAGSFLGASAPGTTSGFDVDHTGFTNLVQMGVLEMSSAGNITFTFSGAEAGYSNTFDTFYVGNQTFKGNLTPVGTSFTVNVGAGAVSFGYKQNGGGGFLNNGVAGTAVSLKDGDATTALLTFNDNGNTDGDYDDMVITAVAAVPEIETYGMMLAGLGLMGSIVRRRKAKAA